MPRSRKTIPVLVTSLVLVGSAGWYWSSHHVQPVNVSSQTKLAGVNETTEDRVRSIQELMEQGTVKTYPGDPELKKKSFRVEALLASPPK